MSIMDIFKPKPVAATQQQGTVTTDPNAQNQNNASNTNTNTSAADQNNQTNNTSATPMDKFASLWETDPNAANSTNQPLLGEVDPKKIFEATKGANFASAVSQDTLKAIAAGGDGAIVALQEALNSVTQATLAQSVLATNTMVEKAVSKAIAAQQADIPNLVKQHAAADALRASNPALNNPAADPIIKALEAQIAVKHPNATASQLTEMATGYLSSFADILKPGTTQTTTQNSPTAKQGNDVDWTQWLTTGNAAIKK